MRPLVGIARVIEIPLPPPQANPHNKGRWQSKAAPIKKYRNATCLIARAQGGDGAYKCKVRIHHTWYLGTRPGAKTYKPRDEGNAIQALKAAVDGLVDAGVLIDDSAAYVTWGEFTRNAAAADHRNRACVVLWLEPLLDQPIPKLKDN